MQNKSSLAYAAPLYMKIHEDLRDKIMSCKILPEEKMPTEIELIKEYGVSRHTIRHVLQMLVNEGLVTRQRGRGTFANPLMQESDTPMEYELIRLGGINLPETLITKHQYNFARRVAELTQNRIKVEVHHSSNLGTGTEQLRQVVEGKLPIFGAAVDWLAQLDPDWGVTITPFLFRDLEHLKAFVVSPLAEKLKERLLKHHGIRVIADNWLRPSRILASNKPCFVRKDIEGLRLRIPPIPVYRESWEAIGAVPIEASWQNVRDYIERGMVEATDTTHEAILGLGIHKSAPYITYTHHHYSRACLVMSEKWFQGFRPDIQNSILRAGHEIGELYTSKALEISIKEKEQMIKEGAHFIETDTMPLKEAIRPLAEKMDHDGSWSSGLYKSIQDL